MSQLATLAAEALSRDPACPAIEFEARTFTWGDMRRVADELAAALAASGVAAGSPVVFLPRNRPSAIAALLGLIARDRTTRMAYPFQAPASVARDMRRLQPAVVVAAREDFSPELVAELRAQGAAGIALTEMHAAAVSGLERAGRTAAAAASAEPQLEILTSGTTGPPKQFAVRFDVIAQHYLAGMPKSAIETAPAATQPPPPLLYFPVSNISGVYTTLPALIRAGFVILLDRFDLAAWHRYVLRYQPAIFGLPPAGVQMILDANLPKEDLACIQALGTGAAPLDPTVQRNFEARYGIPILLSYGATEFVGPVSAMTLELFRQYGYAKTLSCGRPMPGAKLRVVNAETGGELPPGQEGLLQVVSPRIGPDWIQTADIAVIDADGFLFHRGRADGAIMRGGFKVLPETIERALLLHPAVAVAAVTGVPDHRLGQVPGAAVQLRPEAAAPSVAELERHVREHVPATHVPAHWRIVEHMPRTVSMKVDRAALRTLFPGAPASPTGR